MLSGVGGEVGLGAWFEVGLTAHWQQCGSTATSQPMAVYVCNHVIYRSQRHGMVNTNIRRNKKSEVSREKPLSAWWWQL